MPTDLTAPTVQALTTVAGAAVLVAVLLFVGVKAAKPSADFMDRFGPLIAVGLGVLVVLFAEFVLKTTATEDLGQGVINGIFAGLTAAGGYDVINGLTKTTGQ